MPGRRSRPRDRQRARPSGAEQRGPARRAAARPAGARAGRSAAQRRAVGRRGRAPASVSDDRRQVGQQPASGTTARGGPPRALALDRRRAATALVERRSRRCAVRRSASRCAPQPSRSPEVVGERPHVEAGRARERGRDTSVALDADAAQARCTRDRRRRGPAAVRPRGPGRRRGRPPTFLAEKGGGICGTLAQERRQSAVATSSGAGAAARPPPARRATDRRPAGAIVGVGGDARAGSSPRSSCRAPARNCARRVARPTTSGSTPVANGSSVPVWPIRAHAERAAHAGDDVVRGRAGRLVDDEDAVHAAASTGCASANPRRRAVRWPSIQRAAGLGCATVGERARDGAAGGVLVAAAAEAASRRAPTSIAPFDRRLTRNCAGSASLKKTTAWISLHGERQVDQALGVVVACRRSREPSRRSRRRTASRPVGVELERAEHGAEQPQPAERCCCRRRCGRRATGSTPASSSLPADVEGARRDARVVERAGVGQDRHVEVRGDLAASAARRARSMTSKTISPHAAAPRVEPVDGAVHRVAGVVVDVDDEVAVEAGEAGARQVAALQHEHRVERRRRRSVRDLDRRPRRETPGAAAARRRG